MIELHLIGYTADLGRLVLDLAGRDGGRYRLVVDEDLFATIDELREQRRQAGLPVGDLVEFADHLGIDPAELERLEASDAAADAAAGRVSAGAAGAADVTIGEPDGAPPAAEPSSPAPFARPAPAPTPSPDRSDRTVRVVEARPRPSDAQAPEPDLADDAGRWEDEEGGMIARFLDERQAKAGSGVEAPDSEPDTDPELPPAAEPELVLEPDPEPEPEPDPEPAPEPEPEPDPEPAPEPEPAPTAVRDAAPTPEPEPETPRRPEDHRQPPRPLDARAGGGPRAAGRSTREPAPPPAVAEAPRATLSPAEIQARLRRGRSVRAVAREAGVDEAWIRRWEAPILAEQARVRERALSARLDRARLGSSSRPLGDAVAQNLAKRGVDPAEAAWEVSRRRDGRWRVAVRYVSRGRKRSATWTYHPDDDAITAASDGARDLGFTRGS